MACMRDGFDQGKLLDGRFLTVSPLNHGSFGMVFTAKDIETGSDVAIKCITKPDAVKDNTHCPAAIGIDDRSEELEIHSRLPAHPNIVNLICNFETLHHQYMVLELCSNGDLYEAIRIGRGPLETEHVRDLMLELVDAIDHLHSHGVYHRDIKPENIFLTASGSMKLGDFGLATSETWSTEFAVGSDRYMAPEQFDSSVYGYGYSPASADVWAIGIVLLNVLFQRNPFATPTPKDPLFADFVHDRQSLFDVFPNMSQDTYNVLVHSLALDPANRSLGAVREAIKAVVSFTVDDEAIDEFCTESVDLMPVATAAREPLRTPSITSPNMSNGEAFPWATALLQTPQKPARQLSTIPDNEPDLFPGSYVSEKLFGDADEASLSSQVDSGLGMSYKSAKSVKSLASKKVVIGSLPINFSRPTKTSPYGATGSGFSKSWSDLYDEEEELELELEQETPVAADMERVDTVKPSTPQLTSAADDDRGSATPRPIHAVPAIPPHIEDMRTASPLRRMVEEDKANPESTRQRTASVMDRWAALGIRRRAKAEAAAPTLTTSVTTAIPAPPPIPKSKYSDAFASFSPFTSSKKQKSRPKTSHDDSTSWRQGSPQRLRSTSFNRSRVWERKEQSPSQEKWSLDNNWRQHMSPAATKTSPPLQKSPSRPTKTDKSFLDLEFDDGIGDLQFGLDMAGNDDVEWKGSGWHHDFL